ncbi:TetR/AcrR family transcriptional regulator [Streptomonospora salina]|uniref:AcrR family transcriptional regulator n=1 Tax=Streptomonospora salina TaxID=104205 RepID=A0A841ED54_9ACTN|nr:TetR/AcrR family transcriptional regulator [Streptomonospora salina]MBB6001062.1 AcrR family transcriptional regulator [Streptomonospora salina]
MPARGRPRRFDRTAALRTAMVLFWEHGYEGTSLSALTSAMGITATSLYAAFGSKEQVFREAVELYNSDSAASEEALAAGPTAREAIETMLRENAAAYVDPSTPRGCMVVLAGMNLTAANEGVGRYLAACRAGDRANVVARLRRGVREGELSSSADPEDVADYYLTVLHGLSIQARDGFTLEQADAVVDTAMAAWDGFARGSGGGAASAHERA